MPHRQVRSAPLIIACFLAASVVSPAAIATEWSITPSVNLQELYYDNILMLPTPQPSVTGTVLTPRLDLTARQEDWDLTGFARWRNSRFTGQNGIDTNDQYLNLASDYKTERNTWQIGGNYAKESLLTGSQNVADIGLVHTQTQSITRSIAPTWIWTANESTQVQLAYQRSIVTYGNGTAVGLFNYNQDSTTLTVSNQINERTQVFAILSYSTFRVPVMQVSGTEMTSKTSSAQLGVTRKFSATLTGSLAVGGQHTRTSGIQCNSFIFQLSGQCYPEASSSKDSGSVYNASVQKQFERSNVSLTLGRAVAPSGEGAQVRSDSAVLSASWQFSERLLGTISANSYRIRALSANAAGFDRNYYSGGPGLRWQWTENLTANAVYQRLWQRGTGAGAPSASSNEIYLTLNYAWPAFSLSR